MIGKSTFAAAAKALSDQGAPQFDGTSEIQEIKVLGDWAFMWTKLSVVITPPGGAPSVTRARHTLSILRKQNGKWQQFLSTASFLWHTHCACSEGRRRHE
jgi:ketosteroid isomerase-like protein